jgi:hypothetical protein
MTHDEVIRRFEGRKNRHLIYSILLELGGMATYLIPFLGEIGDIIYAPFYGIAIFAMYRMRVVSAAIGGIGGFAEELIPGADIIPSASIMWAYNYILKRDSTLDKFVKRMMRDRDIIEGRTERAYNPKPSFLKRLGSSILSVFYEAPQKRLPQPSEQQIEILPADDADNETL